MNNSIILQQNDCQGRCYSTNSTLLLCKMIVKAIVIALIVLCYSIHFCSKLMAQSHDHHHGSKQKISSSSLSLDINADCAVCLRKISSAEPLQVLPTCHHGFHAHCIDAWLVLHSTCPLCRANVPFCSPQRAGLVSSYM